MVLSNANFDALSKELTESQIELGINRVSARPVDDVTPPVVDDYKVSTSNRHFRNSSISVFLQFYLFVKIKAMIRLLICLIFCLMVGCARSSHIHQSTKPFLRPLIFLLKIKISLIMDGTFNQP